MMLLNAVSFFSSKVGRFSLAIFGAAMLFASAYLKGRRSGIESEKQRALASDIETRRTRDEIDRKVGTTSGSSAVDRLRQDWRRD
jgi:hypothetical protein